MELKEAREIAKNFQKPTFYDHEIVLILDDRITELEAALRNLLRSSGYEGSLQSYSKDREAALKILAKGE